MPDKIFKDFLHRINRLQCTRIIPKFGISSVIDARNKIVQTIHIQRKK